LPLSESLEDDVILAYEMNGKPLLPQHGFPLRLIKPGWYGMASVKWLYRIDLIDKPFNGYQMRSYTYRKHKGDPGQQITTVKVKSLMVPPGVPDFYNRQRYCKPGPTIIKGRAWAGKLDIKKVEVSTDGGKTWSTAKTGKKMADSSWYEWEYLWEAKIGNHILCVRASDELGNVQPFDAPPNDGGFANNNSQKVKVIVTGDLDLDLDAKL